MVPNLVHQWHHPLLGLLDLPSHIISWSFTACSAIENDNIYWPINWCWTCSTVPMCWLIDFNSFMTWVQWSPSVREDSTIASRTNLVCTEGFTSGIVMTPNNLHVEDARARWHQSRSHQSTTTTWRRRWRRGSHRRPLNPIPSVAHADRRRGQRWGVRTRTRKSPRIAR